MAVPMKLERLTRHSREALYKATGIEEIKPEAVLTGRSAGGRKPFLQWQVDLINWRDQHKMNNKELAESLGIPHHTAGDYTSKTMPYSKISVLYRIKISKLLQKPEYNPLNGLNSWQVKLGEWAAANNMEPAEIARKCSIHKDAVGRYFRERKNLDLVKQDYRQKLHKLTGIAEIVEGEKAEAQIIPQPVQPQRQTPPSGSFDELLDKCRDIGALAQMLAGKSMPVRAPESLGAEWLVYKLIQEGERLAKGSKDARTALRKKGFGPDVGYMITLWTALFEGDDQLATTTQYGSVNRKRMREILGEDK